MSEIGEATMPPRSRQGIRRPAPESRPHRRLDRFIGHPFAFLATAAALFAIFGTTFLLNPDRVAPGDDPAFYTWRTEALLSETTPEILDIRGPRDVLAGGYRVTSPVLGGILRRLADIHPLTYTILLTVSLRCLTALLLAGFAYRTRRDPLIFHAVAFGSASLFLTPPFYGYLDNMLCLFFLSCALFLLAPSGRTWPARIGLGILLLASGLTHPTTLVIFFAVLCVMGAVRLVVRGFDFRSVWDDDGPMLVVGLLSIVVTYAVWKLGIWGRPAALSEAAVPPPADQDFFMARLRLWLSTMQLPLNGPLFLIGAVGLLAAGRRAAEDELARVSILWLAPLAGVFGFLAGFSYPYYRFFNTTLAWVLLVGVGAYFVVRFMATRALVLGVLGAVAVAAVFVSNFSQNYHLWNDPGEAWLVGDQRQDLAALKNALQRSGDGRPVVFVTDTVKEGSTRIYGDMKFAANISRSGLPHGYLDRGHVYLGDLGNFLAGRPTGMGDPGPIPERGEFYVDLSEDTLADATSNIDRIGRDPIVVVMDVFNLTGANEGLADSGAISSAPDSVWTVIDGRVTDATSGREVPAADPEPEAGTTHLLVVAGLLALILVPGYFLLRWMLPDAGLAEALGLVPGLAVAALALTGMIVLAIARSELSPGLAWVAFASVLVGSVLVGTLGSSRSAPT